MTGATHSAVRQWLNARRIKIDDLREAGFVAYENGDGVEFRADYMHADGSTSTRVLHLPPPDGGAWRWKKGAIAKGSVLAFGDPQTAATIVICEGESDGLAAWRALRDDFDCSVLVIPGAGMVGDDLTNHIGHGARVIVAFDGDEAGDEGAAKARRVLLAAGVTANLVTRFRPPEGQDLRAIVERLEDDGADFPGDLLALLAEAEPARPPSEPDWPDPIQLAGADRPAFPVKALPRVVRDWCDGVSRAIQTPPDIAAAAALGVLSVVAGDVEVEVNHGWREPLAIYIAAIAESGEGKGPVVKAATAPLEDLQRALQAAGRERVLAGQARFAVAEKRVQAAITAASKAEGAERYVAEAALDDAIAAFAGMTRPEHFRVLADDCTPEALVSLLATHGRIGVVSDEGGIFDTLAGRYSDGVANLDAVLKAWSRLPIRVDRKAYEPEHIPAPVLTIAIAVQPIVTERLAADPLLRQRGLPARFVYMWPRTTLGGRSDDAPGVPVQIEADWSKLVRDVWDLYNAQPAQPPGGVGDSGGSAGSASIGVVLTLTPEAVAVHRAFRGYLEPRLHPESGDLYGANGWAGKLPGQVVRLAGLLHVAEHADEVSTAISGDTMKAAVVIGLYLIDHALAVFGLDGPGGALASDAKRVLRWIQKDRRVSFSHRDAFDALRTRWRPTAESWRPVLKLLEDLGYIRPAAAEPEPGPQGGRPPSPIFDVNPSVIGGAS